MLKLGQLYGRDLRNNEMALAYMLKASSIDPTNVDVLSKLGIVYSMMGNSNLAIDTFNRVLLLDEENANAIFNLGITYLNLGKKEEGEELIQRAVELDPSLNR